MGEVSGALLVMVHPSAPGRAGRQRSVASPVWFRLGRVGPDTDLAGRPPSRSRERVTSRLGTLVTPVTVTVRERPDPPRRATRALSCATRG